MVDASAKQLRSQGSEMSYINVNNTKLNIILFSGTLSHPLTPTPCFSLCRTGALLGNANNYLTFPTRPVGPPTPNRVPSITCACNKYMLSELSNDLNHLFCCSDKKSHYYFSSDILVSFFLFFFTQKDNPDIYHGAMAHHFCFHLFISLAFWKQRQFLCICSTSSNPQSTSPYPNAACNWFSFPLLTLSWKTGVPSATSSTTCLQWVLKAGYSFFEWNQIVIILWRLKGFLYWAFEMQSCPNKELHSMTMSWQFLPDVPKIPQTALLVRPGQTRTISAIQFFRL